jgi:la-related protein 1
MDSEGWIDIPMIASFNRVKSLTLDTNIIREVLTLSSLLEVRDEKVRLANGESKRWVLPDAKQSTLSPEPPVDEALGIPSGLEGVEPQLQPKYGPGDVENALMKSVPPSSSASLLNGDDSMEKTDTPATSMSGDGKEEEDDKVEVR